MRILSLLILLFGALTISQAQITEVQTLTLENNETAGTFSFPDDPTKTYEKIWMVYQMRCHEAQVGSGAVGCREWDYSCNTFITDPTRLDSTSATHPSRIIPGFTGDAFDYSTTPTFSYQSINQQDMVHGAVVAENTATVGNESTPSNFYETPYRKMQWLYTADELSDAGLTAGDITDLRFDISVVADPINFLKIKMKNATADALDATSPELDGFTEHYNKTTNFTQTGWHQLAFHQPFNWDGTSNVIVEMTYTSANPSFGNYFNSTETNFDASLSASSDGHLDFNGSGEIRYEVSQLKKIDDQVTVAFWSYGDENFLPASTTFIEGVDEANNRAINIHLPWGNSRIFWDCGNDGATYDRIDKAATAEEIAGKWNHWAFTKNATTGDMKIYLNAELWHSATGKTLPINIDQFILGKNLGGTRHYTGSVDDFQIWDVELDEATLKQWYRQSDLSFHPMTNSLLSHLTFSNDDGTLIQESEWVVDGAMDQSYTGAPVHRYKQGENLFKEFKTQNFRPNIRFEQNTYTGDIVNTIAVVDSIQNPQFAIYYYAVDGTDLIQTNTNYYWQAGTQLILNENGEEVGSVDFPSEGTININDLTYFLKRESKYEILSLVTPYGNGLDLGQEGKTYTFDVTDYAPILKGERTLSVEMGGQNQEELDIKFLFVEGTPARPVLNIQNIWPFARGYFDPILNDAIFEPREVAIDADAAQVKIRSSITGHGQNGEFVSREHYININEGAKEFEYEVWKRCSQNPVYPQGGTWTFDRAGWCPGMATDVHEFDITSMVNPGGTAIIDYGLNGNTMTEANYLVSNQLVTYGPNSFQLDAEIVEIQRPTNRVEFARFNPTCDDPLIVIRNTGLQALQSLTFNYGVVGNTALNYTWTGNLAFMETTEVLLPVDNLSFWGTESDDGTFEVSISGPNGNVDQYSANNSMTSTFEAFDTYNQAGLQFELRTNLRPNENKLIVKDGSGATLGTLDNLEASTTYIQEIDFPAGCYSVTLEDSGDDGLYYWYWAAVGQNVGAGSLKVSYALTPDIQLPLMSFEPEFGGDLYYNFSIPETVNNKDLTELRRFLLYPNPSNGLYTLELEGLPTDDLQIEIVADNGKVISKTNATPVNGKINTILDIEHQPAGTYFVRAINKDRVWVKSMVKI